MELIEKVRRDPIVKDIREVAWVKTAVIQNIAEKHDESHLFKRLKEKKVLKLVREDDPTEGAVIFHFGELCLVIIVELKRP